MSEGTQGGNTLGGLLGHFRAYIWCDGMGVGGNSSLAMPFAGKSEAVPLVSGVADYPCDNPVLVVAPVVIVIYLMLIHPLGSLFW